MRPTMGLVGDSRDGVTDEAALLRARKTGRLWGAALDAFVQDPLPPDSPLRGLDSVTLTPNCSSVYAG